VILDAEALVVDLRTTRLRKNGYKADRTRNVIFYGDDNHALVMSRDFLI
jgi:hypothetical protein